MKIRGHGNAIAIALAALAVVIAGTGTAVAVSATVVHIEDGYTAGRYVHVDTSGHLFTTGTTSTIDTTGLIGNLNNADNFITSSTTATLAITKLSLNEPSINSSATYAAVRIFLERTNADSSGTCTGTGPVLLGIYNVGPGDTSEDVFPAPLLVKPTGSTKYCLDLYASTLNGNYSASYYPSYNVAAYVVLGSYSGIGLNATNNGPAAVTRGEPAKHK